MLMVAIAFFTLAAALGLFLLSYVLQDKETPKAVAFTHGPVAAMGLLILIIYSFFHTPAPIASIVIFAMAALGGTVLIYKDLTGHALPKWLAVGHGMVAVIGYLLLLSFTFM